MSIPTLWQLHLSIFSEKARWALDFKNVPHRRRSMLSGLHPYTLRVTGRGSSVPVLDIDGDHVADSTEIIRILEDRYPEPRLYPQGADLERALAVEDFFDEYCGHDLRKVVLDSVFQDPKLVAKYMLADQPAIIRKPAPRVFRLAEPVLRRNYGMTDAATREARAVLVRALDRLESQLAGGDYLVGDQFTVADLTAAALLAHIVLPPEYPYPSYSAEELPTDLREFRASIEGRPAFAWVREMYRRHRGESAETR